jgi:hypothetical protein
MLHRPRRDRRRRRRPASPPPADHDAGARPARHPREIAARCRRAAPRYAIAVSRNCLLLAALAACDPFGWTGGGEPSGEQRSLAVCLDACPPDDAACRSRCEAAFKAPRPAAIDDGFTQAVTCMHGCLSAAEKAVCRATCRTAAVAEDAGAAAALAGLEWCVATCHGDATLSDDGRTTCELTCAEDARRKAGR